jgi:beta-glucosidase
VFAAARVRGYLAGGLMPAVKHFVGYGAGEAGRDYNSALIPTSELYDRHLPPFKAAIDAGARSVMASLNAINGVPSTANRYLLDTVLRRGMGFTGMVTSDFNAIGELMNHGLAGDLATASRLALKAGVDLDMEGYGYERHLADDVKAGRVPLAEIDKAVTRVLTLKAQMGLFTAKPRPPAPDERETRKAAREIARESMVLLKNERAALPVATSVKTIALIGTGATADIDDSWWGPAGLTQPKTQTLLEALRDRLAPGQTVIHEAGLADRCGKEPGDTASAVAAAERADLIVLIVTEDCEYSGEGTSRTNLDLSGPQQALLESLSAKADAVLFAWLPRTEGRTAIAEVLMGEINPSGKLPMTMPRSAGQIPISYNVLPTSRPPTESRYTSRYLDEDVSPLYPFGHGLSYTSFAYANLKTSSPHLDSKSPLTVTVEVTNTGSRAGAEVVQLYTRQPVASRSRPVRELRGFEKVRLRAGETKTVKITLTAAALAFHDDTGKALIEPGRIEIYAGGTSAATVSTQVELR